MKVVWSCTLTALLLFSMYGISAAGEKAAGIVPAAVNETTHTPERETAPEDGQVTKLAAWLVEPKAAPVPENTPVPGNALEPKAALVPGNAPGRETGLGRENAPGREKGPETRQQAVCGQGSLMAQGQAAEQNERETAPETRPAVGLQAVPMEKGNGVSRMGLRDCMSYAVSNSTKMRIRQAATGDAQINRREAILKAYLPSVQGSTYAYYNFGRSIDPQTNTYFNQTSFHNNYGINAGIALFDGFSAVNNIKIAKTSLMMGRTEEEQAEADICLAVMQAFCNAVYYARLKDIQQEQVAVAAQSYEKARFQEELGQKGHADVVQMEANLAEGEYDLVMAQNAYVEHLSKLMDLMFWPVDEALELEFNSDDIEETVADIPETVDVVTFAKFNDPSIRLAQGKVMNAKRELSTAKWSLLPSLGLYGGWSTSYYTYGGGAGSTNPFKEQFKNNGGEYVELSLSIPIFSAASRHNNIARKRNALTTATAEYQQKTHEIESEVTRACNDFDGAVNGYTQACRKAELQEEAFRLNTRKMEQGLISSIEHKTSANSYLKAMADKLNMRLQMLIKGSIVRYYNGENYIEQF